MPFRNAVRVIAKVAFWLFLAGFCVSFWWVLLDHFGFYAIGALIVGGLILLLLTLWMELSNRQAPGTPGVCRYCGCTDDRACHGGCGWADHTRTICDAPLCQMRKAADQ